MATSFEEILTTHCLSEEYLTRICSEEHRDELTKRMKDWKAVGAALGFTREELDMIDSDPFTNEEQKEATLLFQWNMREKKNATYLNLAKSLFAGGLVDLLQELCSLVPKATPTTPADQSSSGDVSRGAEPSCLEEEETGNQEAELKNGAGALELYRSESQMSESAPDTSHEPHLKSELNRANGVKLSEKDLVHLMRLLQSYSYQWNPIGLSLGFIQPELKTISGMLALLTGAPVSYLQELLSQWVQWPTADHPSHPTLGALCTALRSSLVGLGSLAEEVEKEMKQCAAATGIVHYSDQDVSDKIEKLEAQFSDLHACILVELEESEAYDIQKVLHALTLLPTKLRNEYQKLILDKLPTLRSEKSISELFLHLNPLFSFLDYSLLEHIIKKFGSTSLKDRMKSYCHEAQNFMSQTTVQQLIDYNGPCEEEIAQNISKMIATIKKSLQTCNLVELDAIRRKICIQARLVDVICTVVSVKTSHSFLVIWGIPLVLVPDMIKSLELADDGFFSENDIHTLSVGDKLVHSPLTKFSDKLRKRYQIATQTTVSHAEWITSPTRKIFRLAMIQREQVQHGRIDDQFVRMTISGKIDDILHSKSPVELRNIFKDEEQRTVLIEGAPGSGKTTLTIFICQKWGKGELFQQFTAVILVQLRDPAVQRAQTIADLLPVENAAISQELADEIITTNGRGVLWVLDGWDELPPHLQQDSIFRKLLPPKPNEQKLAEIEKDPVYNKYVARKCTKVELWLLYLQNNPGYRTQYYKDRLLNETSIIVTSRPISSGDLHPVVSSRIEVLGFTPEEQRQYFTECLKGDKALEALLENIQENPVIQSSCYLPLNAALTVHYFKIKGYSLPSSEYEVFSTNILHCIRRHFEREGRGRELPAQLVSLHDLSRSEAVREPFQCLCELAYHGVMENKVTFSSGDLRQGSNTLSLLQVIESFLQSGKSVFYNFYHLSFQELLAGYYIATSLSDSEQVSQFHQLFHQPRFVGVFQFYAAITKLKTPGIDTIISEIVSKESKPHLLSLLHCLYEAQDPSLCQSVVNQLEVLNFSGTSLSPMDLLSIGYLISISDTNVFNEVKLGIGDHGVKTLMKYLACGKGAGTWKFDLKWNDIHEEGAASIAKVLRNSSVMNSLDLTANPIGAGGLQSLAEALITNTSLVELNLYQCSCEITDENGPIVTEMLQRNKTLRYLNLLNTHIMSDAGIVYITKGLKKNTALKCLEINGIGAVGGKALVSAIATNTSLPLVKLTLRGYDMITEDSKQAFIDMLQQNTAIETLHLSSEGTYRSPVPFLAEALQNNSTLKELDLYHYLLTPDMVKDVSRMLIVNCSLTSLSMHGNPIGNDGVIHLAEALKQNKTLERLDISSCSITDAGVATLAEALQVNSSLCWLNIDGNFLTHNAETKLMELAAKKPKFWVYDIM